MLGEAGELAAAILANVDDLLDSRVREQSENSSAVFPVKPMVQRRRSMRSRNTRWLREMREMQSLSTGEPGRP